MHEILTTVVDDNLNLKEIKVKTVGLAEFGLNKGISKTAFYRFVDFLMYPKPKELWMQWNGEYSLLHLEACWEAWLDPEMME